MPDLVEKQIRDAVVTVLTGLTTTGANVFPYRFYPVAENQLPALLVYTDDEEIEPDTLATLGGGHKKAHKLEVRIEVLEKQSLEVEGTIALIYKEVIIALEADPTLGGLVKDLMNTSNSKDTNDEGEQPAIAGIMTWQAEYRTVEGAPDVSVS